MTKKDWAIKIVNQMYDDDPFCKLLGIKIVEINPGACKIKMQVKRNMLNSQKIAHGAISYTLADTALAYASNSRGKKSVSVETSISHVAPVKEGDTIFATAGEVSVSNKIGVYQIKLTNQENIIVGFFKGIVYRTSKNWFEDFRVE